MRTECLLLRSNLFIYKSESAEKKKTLSLSLSDTLPISLLRVVVSLVVSLFSKRSKHRVSSLRFFFFEENISFFSFESLLQTKHFFELWRETRDVREMQKETKKYQKKYPTHHHQKIRTTTEQLSSLKSSLTNLLKEREETFHRRPRERLREKRER